MHAPKEYTKRAWFGRQLAPGGVDAGAGEGGEDFEAGDVEVGEVGAVGFVQVVVAFEEGGAGGCYHGGEEG